MKKRSPKKQLREDSNSGPQVSRPPRANASVMRPPGLFSGASLNGGMNPVERNVMTAPKVSDRVVRQNLLMARPRGRGG